MADLFRPIIGIENRTPQEVFDILCDRFRSALVPTPQSELQAENALEDAAKAAFVSAQSIYRAEHDHFPLKHTWETIHETIRDGWRKIAHASLEAAATPPLGTQPEPRRARSIADIASPTPPPVEAAQEPVAWRNVADAPTVSKGNERLFVVAVRRARTGKVHTFPANYLNAYPLHFDEPCKECPGEGKGCGMEDGDGCPRTGWHTCSEGGEYDYTYSRLHLDPGDEHVGWCEFPSYAAPATGWRTMESAPKDGTRILLAKIVGHVDHPTALWWATVGFWSAKWNNWNDGLEPSGLAEPSHWMPISAHGVGWMPLPPPLHAEGE